MALEAKGLGVRMALGAKKLGVGMALGAKRSEGLLEVELGWDGLGTFLLTKLSDWVQDCELWIEGKDSDLRDWEDGLKLLTCNGILHCFEQNGEVNAIDGSIQSMSELCLKSQERPRIIELWPMLVISKTMVS